MENIFDWSVILSLVGVLVVITNIIVQVLKKLTWDKLPTNILATLVAIVLTLGAFFAYCQIKSITVVWYMVAAALLPAEAVLLSPAGHRKCGDFETGRNRLLQDGHSPHLKGRSPCACGGI